VVPQIHPGLTLPDQLLLNPIQLFLVRLHFGLDFCDAWDIELGKAGGLKVPGKACLRAGDGSGLAEEFNRISMPDRELRLS
jgi:hypothetical protein